MKTVKFRWWKFLLAYGLYIFFHEINRILPGTLGTVFGEGFESIYAHMKMLFYAYLLISVLDYFRYRGNLPVNFFPARMLILAAVPWMMIIVYYAVEAAGIVLPHAIDLTWALVVTGFGIYFSMRLEEPLENLPMQYPVKTVILVAFLAAVITYIGFSIHIPDNFFVALD